MENDQSFIKITDNVYLNKYKLIDQGSFARVFQGCDTKTGEVIAIKEVFPKQYKMNKDLIHRQRGILEELKLTPHPNIMKYLGSAEANGTIYFFMELCVSSVESRLLKESRIPEYLVMKWFRQLLQGLTFLHGHSIMHRDLKPANLLLDEFDNIKIADFGLAKHDEVVNTLGAGTPLYKAPEVYNYVNYDDRCDVWSAGLILYELLTGLPFFHDVTTISELKYKHSLIGKGKVEIAMPKDQEKDYDKVWGDFVKTMLVYSFQQRKRAKDVLEMYRSIFKELDDKIRKKLSFIDIDLSQVSLTLDSLEKSYHEQNNIHENISLFNHHESFTNLTNLGKFLFYKRTINKLYQKIKIYAGPKVKRNGKELPNEYVYTLIFLILAIQVQKNKELEQQLKNEEIKLPEIKLIGKQFELYHKNQFQGLMKQHLTELKVVQPEIKKQLMSIAGKFKDYLERKEKKAILLAKYDKICLLTEEFRTGDKLPSIDLLFNLYIAYVTMKDFKIRSEEYQNVEIMELRMYFLMHALAHLDEYFQPKQYASTQYLINRRERLQTENRQSMIEQLRKWMP